MVKAILLLFLVLAAVALLRRKLQKPSQPVKETTVELKACPKCGAHHSVKESCIL